MAGTMERGHRRRDRVAPVPAVLRFAGVGLVVVVALGFGVTVLMRGAGTDEALHNARDFAGMVGQGIVAPELSDALMAGDPAARGVFDRVVRDRALRDPVVRVKLWSADGQIVYADEPRLIGLRYPLRADEKRIVERGGVAAELSEVDAAENRFERGRGELLEVYQRVTAPGGQRLLLEIYLRYSDVASSAERIWIGFLPYLVGALAALWITQVPLAWSLARRLRAGQRERESLLEHAMDAATEERRQIAADLHDGVVQDLVAMQYQLRTVAARLPLADANADAGANADADYVRSSLQHAARTSGSSARALRTLAVEIYPPDLHEIGLPQALSDLVGKARAHGIEGELSVSDHLKIDERTEALVFRATSEALRNVVRHASADRVRVDVSNGNGAVRVVVEDDGCGFDPGSTVATDGHLGLRLLEDLVAEAGGTLEVESSANVGTRVRVAVPAR